ncbi:protein kinase domain-containing protein [Amycolatopsis suaedae]|uniref:non-specific serine/threonine protein kinase n=1 Tax=Amycolatopsis suaedae TaxID=2510978 RepID=A0A4Q7IYL8_9PSEU|nr:FHA domain-containing serine/threonine-protein kinase [Amycolatopsis suaedae]RZQ60091.1 FHA domain-containing protein [Amycolatopsis suaedae]
MRASVTLAVTAGTDAGAEYTFHERTTRIVGRAADCDPRLSGGRVSRHHCLFDINPPDVRVRDLGSLNGTHVNGEEIGRRQAGQTPEEGARLWFPERDLLDGDEVRIGRSVLRVRVTAPATGPSRGRCAHCGAEVKADPAGGDVLCATCRRDPATAARLLLERAARGEPEVVTLQGFTLVRELGRGGQGAVFLAEHDVTGERIALKILLPRIAARPMARQGFLREIDSTRALRHPNIVRFVEGGASGATFFLASEYCTAGSVREWVPAQGGTLSPDVAVPLVMQALDGLDHAHRATIPDVPLADGKLGRGRGLVHRDVKPANLLLAGVPGERVLKVGDFGISKAFDMAGLSGHTHTGAVAGTMAFMARPQLVNFKFAKPAVDVWAAAASLYWMLTGHTPRDFPPGQDPISVVLGTEPVPVRTRVPGIPRRLAEVIDHALVDHPEIAVRSAGDLARMLREAL